jgi:Caspase domain
MCPASVVVYGTGFGCQAMDRDPQGGNPFASAVLSQLNTPGLAFKAFLEGVREATRTATAGKQSPEWRKLVSSQRWEMNPSMARHAEKREVLLLMVDAYETESWNTLQGVAFDQRRLAAAFAGLGFNVTQRIPPKRSDLMRAISNFAKRTSNLDAAVVYATGHGLANSHGTYLLPGDFPAQGRDTDARLRRGAVCIEQIAGQLAAKRANVVFFAGCRSRPDT